MDKILKFKNSSVYFPTTNKEKIALWDYISRICQTKDCWACVSIQNTPLMPTNIKRRSK